MVIKGVDLITIIVKGVDLTINENKKLCIRFKMCVVFGNKNGKKDREKSLSFFVFKKNLKKTLPFFLTLRYVEVRHEITGGKC